MTTDTIKAIQKQIIVKLEAGKDVSELTRRLAQERVKIATEGELAELQKIADERQQLRDKAEAVKSKVQKQGEAIDAFLSLRDKLVSQLEPLLEPMGELAKMASASWERDPGECYIFNDMGQFAATVRSVPKGYLPADFGCPFLEMKGGQVDAYGKAPEANAYFMAAVGILAGFTKGVRAIPLKPVEGLVAIDNEPETEARSCVICSHAEVETINNLLRQGKPLRDIESEFGVSRSSLSRHKSRCLNEGVIRVTDAA